jgi:hypothetical protein
MHAHGMHIKAPQPLRLHPAAQQTYPIGHPSAASVLISTHLQRTALTP